MVLWAKLLKESGALLFIALTCSLYMLSKRPLPAFVKYPQTKYTMKELSSKVYRLPYYLVGMGCVLFLLDTGIDGFLHREPMTMVDVLSRFFRKMFFATFLGFFLSYLLLLIVYAREQLQQWSYKFIALLPPVLATSYFFFEGIIDVFRWPLLFFILVMIFVVTYIFFIVALELLLSRPRQD